jgi:hypothetical protein
VRRYIAVLGAVAGLLVSGCGGGSSSSGVSAGSYVKVVCTAVRGWVQDIQARSGALNVAPIKNAAQGKAAIQGFFKAAVTSTESVVTKLRSAGTPGVAHGQKIASALTSTFSQIEAALIKGQSQANALPTTSALAFRNAGQALASSVRKSITSVGSGLSGLTSSELEKASKKEPSCAPLGA